MLSRAELKRLRALGRPRGRAESGLFLAEGVRVAEDLLASGAVPRVALVAPSLEDNERGRALAHRLRSRVRTLEVSEEELKAVATTDTPQGVVIAAETPRPSLTEITLQERVFAVVLDGVQDPGNLGTIVRSAEAFGATFVATLPGTVDPWNPKAVRSAAGSSLRLPIVEMGVESLLAFLHDAGFVIMGADLAGEDIAGVPVPARTALVLGNEGAGLSAAVRSACDRLVSVPIHGETESLNVGVAAGILLYLLGRETAT